MVYEYSTNRSQPASLRTGRRLESDFGFFRSTVPCRYICKSTISLLTTSPQLMVYHTYKVTCTYILVLPCYLHINIVTYIHTYNHMVSCLSSTVLCVAKERNVNLSSNVSNISADLQNTRLF